MKKFILNLFVIIGLVFFSTNALSQTRTAEKQKTTKEKKVSKAKKKQIKRIGTKSQKKAVQKKEMKVNGNLQKVGEKAVKVQQSSNILSPSISIITTVPERVPYKSGFLVEGTASPNTKVEVYNKARWEQNGYNTRRTKEYEVIKITSDENGKWKAKVVQPYSSIPATAYDLKFEISSKQFPYDRLATLPSPSIVYGTMAPPEIEETDGEVNLPSSKDFGGSYGSRYSTISGTGIPNMDININVATEYQSPRKRYNSGDAEMNTYLMEGETKTAKISSNGTWSIEVEVPNPHRLNRSFGVYNFKLVVKATQSASSSDVSEEAEKKFDNLKSL